MNSPQPPGLVGSCGGIAAADVASLLAVYGVTGHTRDRLIEKAANADSPGLVESRRGLSRESRTLIQLETEARSIFNLEPLLVPGLLQTPDYTRALMRSGEVPGDEVEVRVTARMGRQSLLSRDTAADLEFVIDEAALRRLLVPAHLMVRQLRHIIESTERPGVTIRVLPLSLGGHSGLDGSFMFLEFARQRAVVHVEHKISALFLEEEHEVDFYRGEIDKLRRTALNPGESADFIATIAKQLEHG